MKKILFLLISIVILQSASIAQESKNYDNFIGKNIIKTNPISMAFGIFKISYETTISDASSLQFGMGYFNQLFGSDVSSFSINAGYKFYLSNKRLTVPEGFYIGPRLSFNAINEDVSDASISNVGLGGLIGYQWIYNSGVTLELGGGPTYHFITAEDDATEDSFDGFLPNLYFTIGYNF